MVKFRHIYSSIFALVCSFSIQADITVNFAYENASQFPYYVGDTSQVLPNKPGAAVEMLKLLETKIPKLNVNFSRCHWKQCLNKLQSGEVDGIFNASFTKDRLLFGRYPMINGDIDESRRITRISYHFYRIKGSSFNWNGEQVSGLFGKVGTPLAYSIETDLKDMGLKILSSPDILENFSNLRRKKVDVIALQDVTGDYFIGRKSGLNQVEKVFPAIKTKSYYLMLSKKFNQQHPELSEQIWDSIKELRKEQLPKLLERYL